MDVVQKERLFCHVRMATGQKAVEQKFVEECAELISELSELQKCVLNGCKIGTDLAKNAIGEIADFVNTLEQVTGDRSVLSEIEVVANEKLSQLQQRAVDGTLTEGMAWRT